jgi:hypothetical protein
MPVQTTPPLLDAPELADLRAEVAKGASFLSPRRVASLLATFDHLIAGREATNADLAKERDAARAHVGRLETALRTYITHAGVLGEALGELREAATAAHGTTYIACEKWREGPCGCDKCLAHERLALALGLDGIDD